MDDRRKGGPEADGAPLIVAFGEALWDLLPGGAVLGGAPLNFAYRCGSLGARGLMVSRLGSDELGRRAEERMRLLGMDTSRIQRDPTHPTGTVSVSVDAAGSPDFTILPEVAYDYIEPDPEVERLVARCACLCYGTLAQRSPTSRATLHRLLDVFGGRYLLLDVNLRRDCYTLESVRSSISRASILKLNETEAPEVARICGLMDGELPELARALLRFAALEICVLTLGAGGCFAVSRSGEAAYEPAFRVRLVDTCGSGDAFSAAFLCSLLRGEGLREACRIGNALGAMVAAQAGATEPVEAAGLAELARVGERMPPDPRFRRFTPTP